MLSNKIRMFGEWNKPVIREINFKRRKDRVSLQKNTKEGNTLGEMYFIIINVKYNDILHLDCESLNDVLRQIV